MATYSSKPTLVNASAEQVYSKLSNPENLKALLDNVPADRLPADQREMLEKIDITPDSIKIPGGPMGSLTLRIVERVEPTLIRLQGEGSPVKMELSMQIKPVSDYQCEVLASINIDIPIMLKPMVSGPMQKMVDQVGTMLGQIPFNG